MCVHADFLDPDDILTAERHCRTLEKTLLQAIRHKRPGLLRQSVQSAIPYAATRIGSGKKYLMILQHSCEWNR
jgi:hypothetical protein